MPLDELVSIGKIIRPHGVRGELQVMILTDFPERFQETEEVHLIPPEGKPLGPAAPWIMQVASVRPHAGRMLVTLEGVTTMDDADRLRKYLMAVPQDELVELEEGEYWDWQLEGLTVVDASGAELGRLQEVLKIPAHDLYSVRTPRGQEILIPAVDEFVLEVDLEGGRMVVKVPEITD